MLYLCVCVWGGGGGGGGLCHHNYIVKWLNLYIEVFLRRQSRYIHYSVPHSLVVKHLCVG